MTLVRFLPDLGIVNREAQLGTIDDVGELVIPEYMLPSGNLQPWVQPYLRDLSLSPVFFEPRILAAFALRIAFARGLVTLSEAGA